MVSDKEIDELKAQLSAKDAKIKERDELITIYARDVNELQHELKGKDALIAELQKEKQPCDSSHEWGEWRDYERDKSCLIRNCNVCGQYQIAPKSTT